MDVVDLSEEYSRELLEKFYNELMIPCFGMFASELDTIDVFQNQLETQTAPKTGFSPAGYRLRILLAIDKKTGSLASCVCCELYPRSRCSLMTYIVTHPNYRRSGLIKLLVKEMFDKMDQDCKKISDGSLRAVFLESNDDSKISSEEDVMNPRIRTEILKKLGWNPLHFQYIQPPLSESQPACKHLVLYIHEKFLLELKADETNVSISTIRDFLREFWSVLVSKPELDHDFMEMMESLQRKDVDELWG